MRTGCLHTLSPRQPEATLSRFGVSIVGLLFLTLVATACATTQSDSRGNPLPPLLPTGLSSLEIAAAKRVVISTSRASPTCRQLGRAGGRDGANAGSEDIVEGIEERARLALQLQVRAMGGNYVFVNYVDRPYRQMITIGGQWQGAISWPYWVLSGTAYDCPDGHYTQDNVDTIGPMIIPSGR